MDMLLLFVSLFSPGFIPKKEGEENGYIYRVSFTNPVYSLRFHFNSGCFMFTISI